MANYPKYDLTGKSPAATYTELTLYNVESASLVNGSGNDLPQLNITTSKSVSASYAGVADVAVSASNATNMISNTGILVHSQDTVFILSTNNMFFSATGALFMEAGGNITMTPRSTVEIQGNLLLDGSMSLAPATVPGVLVNDASGVVSSKAGLNTTKSFTDISNVTHSVFIENGIILNWLTT